MVLSKQTILITRPNGREKHLRQLIENAGGHVIHYPVIDITPPPKPNIKQLMLMRDTLHSFTMAIFISPTAVEQSLLYFPVLPEHFIIVAIGSKTRDALQQQQLNVDIEASSHNTESLLNDSQFQISNIEGQRILIFRGNGGRALLGDTLIQRGAQVRYVETYQRQLPPEPSLTRQQLNTLTAICISSYEGLDNLITLVDDTSLMLDIPLIVPSQRAHTRAQQHGFKNIIDASNATDEATMTVLSEYFKALNSTMGRH